MTMRAKSGLVAAVFLLAACSGQTAGPGAGTPVFGGQVVIAAPRGYCLDSTQRRESQSGAFLLYGTCPGIEGAGPNPVAPAVLTAAVAPGAGELGPDQMAALADILRGPEGKATLSRSGSSDRVSVASFEQTDDLLVIRARDGDTIDLSEDYWRAVFPQSGALVTLTVSGTAATPLDPATGKSLLLAFTKAVRRASPKSRSASPSETGVSTGDKGLRSLLNRLL